MHGLPVPFPPLKECWNDEGGHGAGGVPGQDEPGADRGEGAPTVAMDFDSQLIESVEVRRERLSASFLFGLNPTERRWKDRTNFFVYGLILAALACAFCVGISFIVNIIGNWLAEREERDQQQQQRNEQIQPQPQGAEGHPVPAPAVVSPSDTAVLADIAPPAAPATLAAPATPTAPTTLPPTPWRS